MIEIDGQDVSSDVSPYLIHVEVTDKEGASSDTAKIVLDDADARFALPSKGAPVSISLGTTLRGMRAVFAGKVDTVESKGDRGGGMTLEIEAKGFDTESKVKQPRQKHYDDSSLGDVMSDVAEYSGLSSIKVHPSLASIRREYWSMDLESPLAFGARIAREVGATFKIAGDVGVIVPRDAGLSASGKALTAINITRGENLISWSIRPFNGRPTHKSVTAQWYDHAEAKWKSKEVTIDDAASVGSHIVRPRATEDDANRAAGAEGKDHEREKGGGTVVINGDPSALAGAPVILSGLRPGIDATYKADEVKHSLTRKAGFLTEVSVVQPGEGAGKDKRKGKRKTK